MKTFFLILLAFCSLFVNAQTWAQKASLPPSQVGYYAASFSIGGKIYAGGGYWAGAPLNTFFEYDPATDTWAAKANMPNSLFAAAFFTINGKGYVVCGQDHTTTNVTVYMYDPVTNSWTQKNNFPGTARYNTIGFSLNGKGYVFGGFIGGSTVLNDMWEYDPTADSWTQKANAPGPGRDGPVAQIISNQAYIGMGCAVNGIPGYTDFYRFDPVANSYTQVASIPRRRAACAHFEIGGIGYFGLGQIDSGSITTVEDDFYKYDPVANSWTQINNFGGAMRGWVFSEVVAGKPYVGAGSYLQSNIFYNDLWTWDSCHSRVTLGNDTTLCTGNSLILKDTAANATFLWNTGANTSSISVTTGGAYWLEETSNGCHSRDTINIFFNSPPAAFSLGKDTALCNGNSLTLRDTASNVTFLWNTGATTSSISVNTGGVYWVEETQNGCHAKDTIAISFNSPPAAFSLGNDTFYCGNFTRTLSTGVAGTTWSTGGSGASISTSSPGLYWAQVANQCGTVRDSIVFGQTPVPIVDLGNDTSLCAGNQLVLDATTGNATYLWIDGSTGSALNVSTSGVYWVDVRVNGCDKRDSILVNYISAPHITGLAADTTICADSFLILNVYGSNLHYHWSNGDTTASIIVNQAQQYNVTVSNLCGMDSATENIQTRSCTCKVAIPTAFSPNNDGKNDGFGMLSNCPVQNYKMTIYNRWGQLIYASDNLGDRWDGTYKNQPQPVGVYVCYIQYTDPYTTERKSINGNVTLLR